MKRMEIRIVIPDVLKGQLVDDWENVTKNQQVPYMFRHKMVYCLILLILYAVTLACYTSTKTKRSAVIASVQKRKYNKG